MPALGLVLSGALSCTGDPGVSGDGGNAAAPKPRPNVVLIVLDTTRADFLSGYGFPEPTTPRIDALAAEGVRYTRTFSTCFWTLPAHASLLTGLYPTEAQATSVTNRLPEEVTTLAEILRDGGYRTYAAAANSWLSEERGFGQGFDELAETWRGRDPEEAAVRRAVEWVTAAAAGGEPFFLFVNLNTPHLPYNPPFSLRRRFLSQEWPPERVERLTRLQGGFAHLAGALPLDETDYRILRQLYAAEVHAADAQAGGIILALRAAGVLDSTMVIVTSDHGENIGEHGMIDHVLSMYDTTLHVPLVIRFPERLPAGAVEEDLVSLVDVFPTVLDAAGLVDPERRPYVERFSLLSARRRPRREVLAENDRPVNGVRLLSRRFPEFDTEPVDRPMRMIRTGAYKLIQRLGWGVELYHLAADPAERHDLAASLPGRQDELRRRLEERMAALEPAAEVAPLENPDPEALERLRALGYVD